MSAAERGPGRAARACVLLLGVSLIAAGTLIVLASGTQPGVLNPPFRIPWWLLAPLYVLTSRLTVDFEFRKDSHSIALTQLPVALGLVFVSPIAHLAARLVASMVDLAARRSPPLKIFFNLGVDAMEVALATGAVTLLGRSHAPGPSLWIGLLLGMLASEVIGHISFAAVMRLMGAPTTFNRLGRTLGFALISASVFACLAVVAVTAMWTERRVVVVILLLAGSLTVAYRGHRRLSAQQRTTEALYDFVKELGPLSADGQETREVLEHIRVLLHARHLDLALSAGTDGTWRHMAVFDGAPLAPFDATVIANSVARSGAAAPPSGPHDRMATPLLGMNGVIGVLTVADRLGSNRGFDMGDLRLLETVATELTTALERGKLLGDLGLAATTDPLTRLPNLSDVTQRLDAALRSNVAILVAAVAVDSFREVNDTLGHQVGDELLVEVTRRLSLSHPHAIVGRIGGGRFAVAVQSDEAWGDPSMFGLGIRAQVEGGAQLGAIGTHIRLTVGVASAPEHGRDGATLIRRAETAMYGARHSQGGPVVWEPAYEIAGQRRLAVVMALREALAGGAIGVAFQPKLDTQTGQVTGVEALARWTHPALGAIGPDEFIPLAEASGLMGPLTTTVLRQSLTACQGWQRRGGRIGVAVNVSADTVLDPNFVTEVSAIITSVGIDPDLLTLELTEGVVVEDPVLAAVRMHELRAFGVKLSVDDFGTGYSSLTYLKGLPVNEVKIDKGFIDDVVEDAGDRAVVRAVVDIAHTLGMTVVAEGIEHENQYRVLTALGVDETQGYFHARPMAAVDMAAWLRRQESARR